MSSRRVLSGAAAIGFLLGLVAATFPPPAYATHTGFFNVAHQLRTITPTANTTVDGTSVNPTCDSQGGTSIAIVQGSKLKNVDPDHEFLTNVPTPPVLVVVSCFATGNQATPKDKRARLNFLDPSTGKVIKSIRTRTSTTDPFAPSNGWAHLVSRFDKGDLLGCGSDGTLYSIDYSRFPSSLNDGTAKPILGSGLTSCLALGWDPEEDMIYQGVSGGTNKVGVRRFNEGQAATTLFTTGDANCTPSGVAITGGVLVVACKNNTILRLDKTTGLALSPNGTLTAASLAPLSPDPGLGDLACDPTTFQKRNTSDQPTTTDQFRDAMWSRRGPNGNGVVAIEFPAFTCGLPANATVLAAGLSAPGPAGPGAVPLAACFDPQGNVIDEDEDGLPNCWETNDIDFDGDGVIDLQLSVQVDTDCDGTPDATASANPQHKDIFVEIAYMDGRKPDPLALCQPPSGPDSVAQAGVKSVREAFAAAPGNNPDGTTGVLIHFEVDPSPVSFTTLAGGTASFVQNLVFTPLTPAGTPGDSNAADFDTIKKENFGTGTDVVKNAKRLAFHYVLFAYNQMSTTSSGAGELGGDDVAITLGSFANLVQEQANTLMHELGHNFGLDHGGGDAVNCKPNYLSVMSYIRQIPGSPIPNVRLDFSRAKLPDQNEASLDETLGLCDSGPTCDPSLDAIVDLNNVTLFAADQTAFGGSGAWTTVTPAAGPINWNLDLILPDPSPVSRNINDGPTCTGGSGTLLKGHDDWGSLNLRFSSGFNFGSGVHTTDMGQQAELTAEQEEELFLSADLDGNGVGDGHDCGAALGGGIFSCTHRIDIKPANSDNIINLGNETDVAVAIFSEVDPTTAQVWYAPAVVVQDVTLKFQGLSVEVNSGGQGTCHSQDVADPETGVKDGYNDLVCKFPTSGFLPGTRYGILEGFFVDPLTAEARGFRARQLFTVLP